MEAIRTVRFYSFHMHKGNEPINYGNFFEFLMTMTGVEVDISRDYTAVLQGIEMESAGTFALTFIGGDPNENTIFFDRATGSTEEESASERRWRGKLTRAYFSFTDGARVLALEGVRSGITANLLEKYFRKVSSDSFGRISVEISPLTSPSFIEEIEQFERIRLASIEVGRPNYGFNDLENALFSTADASDAQSASLSAKAPRGESLNKNEGIVDVIKETVETPNPSVRNVVIEGRKPGASRDQRVTLEKHQERTDISINESQSAAQQTESIFEQMRRAVTNVLSRRTQTRSE